MKKSYTLSKTGLLCAAIGLAVASNAMAGSAPVSQSPSVQGQSASIDFANAIPMPLPKNPMKSSGFAPEAAPQFTGAPGFSPGGAGDGKQSPTLVPQSNFIEENSGISSQDFGTSQHPFSSARVDASGNQTSKFYPYSPTGKLYFNIGAATYVCSASLIRPGVIVTAAHCVADFGGSWYSNWTFVPSLDGTKAPYGTWKTQDAWVMGSYLAGTESCAVAGVVCPNDVAVIRLAPKKNATLGTYYAGNRTGWYGYGWNGYGYTGAFGGTVSHISQLGYPQAIDSGKIMQRNDSMGYVDAGLSSNLVIGSLLTGGSSGGPWLVNLGITPTLSGISFGSAPAYNIVTNVTSWGYTNPVYKQQGASTFTDGNIIPLVNAICPSTASPGC